MEKSDRIEFKKWISDTDVIVKNAKPLLPDDHPVISACMPWAYALNTAKGFYKMDGYKTTDCDVINLPNGETLEFRSTRHVATLTLTTHKGTRCVLDDVTVWAHYHNYDFMIVTHHKTDQTIIIDSRGIPFELPIHDIKHYHHSTIEKNKREGYFLIENKVIVRYKTKQEQTVFEEKTSANLEAVFNKDFNRFVRNNAKNTSKYLYLTVGNSKCGALVRHFVSKGMRYEIIPNIILDDETVNIRIPLEGENALRKDVQFLCAKYFNTYSIYNIPYVEIGHMLELTESQRQKHEKLKIFFSQPFTNGHETIAYSIINTFRAMFNTTSDYEVYKKTFSKVIRLIANGRGEIDNNYFSKYALAHPCDFKSNDEYIAQRMQYIECLLNKNGYQTWSELCQQEDTMYVSERKMSDRKAYRIAFDCSLKLYRQKMDAFESNALQEISNAGGIISKWTNEATLFALVKKEYPDAIFQYHADWLFLQSLDIYIPSLRVGIEYQGEQHYHPVEVFGGEAGFKSLVERDKRKIELCKENKVALIHWKYDEVISTPYLHKKMDEVISDNHKKN